MQLNSLTFAYPDVDGTTRAELARRLSQHGEAAGTFVLSTCLRIEVAVPGDEETLRQATKGVLGEDAPVERGKFRSGGDAVRHLFRVAAGLESPIVGEPEILTQFRQAVIALEESGTVEGLFGKLLETAVSIGRQAREQLPDSPHGSMAAVAAQVVGAAEEVAVFGWGSMARAVTESLAGLPAPPQITVVARNPDKVSVENVDVWSFARAAEALSKFPAVVSATSAKGVLVSDNELAGTLSRRRSPLTLVDMAMPPDFTFDGGSPVRYVDIDDLARMVARRPRQDDADALVAAAAEDAHRRFAHHHALGPVVGALIRNADEVVAHTVDRFAGRLETPGDREILQQTAHTVARTLIAAPVSYLQSANRPDEAVNTIAEAFRLEDE